MTRTALDTSQFSSQHRGHIAELAVATDLSKYGYTISFPAVPAPYDLLAERDNEIVRVQVKTMQYRERYGVMWKILKCRDGKNRPYTTIDLFAGYDPKTGMIYYKWHKDMDEKKEFWINPLSLGSVDNPGLIDETEARR